MTNIKWIGVDWGTSNLRAFAIGSSGEVVDQQTSDRGMGALKSHEFEPALLELIAPWLEEGQVTKVFACGMVGARQGWCEADYRKVPCAPVSSVGMTRVSTVDRRISVHILPGLSQSEPADVMRGEETQIAGYLSQNQGFSGYICLPGTHSKWVEIKGGEVVGFQTFMTGELFSILSKHSVLQHSLTDIGFDHDVFIAAALNAVSAPLSPIVDMFSLRANTLLHNQSPEEASARLSGMLIGQELGAMDAHWASNPVVLIGASEIVELYRELLDQLGVAVSTMSAAEATLSGLKISAIPAEVA